MLLIDQRPLLGPPMGAAQVMLCNRQWSAFDLAAPENLSLLSLPNEILFEIVAHHLPTRDLIAVALTCRRLRGVVASVKTVRIGQPYTNLGVCDHTRDLEPVTLSVNLVCRSLLSGRSTCSTQL